MADELPINVKIAERPYRLIVGRGEEEAIRKAAKLIEGQMSHYAGNYRNSDKQDLLAMVALHFASIGINAQQEAKFVADSLSPSLADIDKVLTEALKD